jgi:hypothetical protein
MIDRKAFAVLGLALASLMGFPNAHASETDEATKLTFGEAVQIPGRVLPAGTYLFVVVPVPSGPAASDFIPSPARSRFAPCSALR